MKFKPQLVSQLQEKWQLALLRRRMFSLAPGVTRTEPLLNYRVRINDGPNFYTLYKDLFLHRIYHFTASRRDPLILDCGSNIGMSILYFKHVYPRARIIGFEPDPVIFPLLRDNVTQNRLEGTEVIQASLSSGKSPQTFFSDGKYGSRLARNGGGSKPEGWNEFQVPCVQLRDYLTEPVDFLKMNIEGAEWEVLSDSEDRLRSVRQAVIEYHHLPGLPRTMHKILELFHRQGFQYLVNNFDRDTNPCAFPPFYLEPESRYFLLIYVKRTD